MKNKIFEVDIKGLRMLQDGKPKWIIVRELLQNAMDEDVTAITIDIKYRYGKMRLTVTDDAPDGFRDIADMYTLFKDTPKRSDVKKRGRFNFGEKQVLVLADFARITSTKGGYEFNMQIGTKKPLRIKRNKGSEVYLEVKMTSAEFVDCVKYCHEILPPKDMTIKVTNNMSESFTLKYAEPHYSFNATIPTELKVADAMKRVLKETEVLLYEELSHKKAYIYEMGIPICEIDCDYSINVQQKVPLSNDRDMVPSGYLKILYGEVLNIVATTMNKEDCSNVWVREGFVSPRARTTARALVINRRFGEKALIANPMDKRSMDEAITNNYNVVYGAEMNKEEWNVIRDNDLMESTSAKFKVQLVDGRVMKPSVDQARIAIFCKRIAKEFLDIDNLVVIYVDAPQATTLADYCNDKVPDTLRFNVAHIPPMYWVFYENRVDVRLLNLIIHELGHSVGLHYEQSYHDCITMLGAQLTKKALSDPEWFNMENKHGAA